MTATKQTELYTCIGKGGLYEYIGLSDGAGMSKGEQRQVYRCTDTGQLYHRETGDFFYRMEPAAHSAEPVQGEAVAYIPVDRETGEHWHPVKRKGSGRICDYIPLYTSPAKPDAELVELIEFVRAKIRAAGRCHTNAVEYLLAEALEAIDAKLAELKGGNHASTPA